MYDTSVVHMVCRGAAGATVAGRPRAGDAGAAAREAAGAGGVRQSGLRGAHPRQVLLQCEVVVTSAEGSFIAVVMAGYHRLHSSRVAVIRGAFLNNRGVHDSTHIHHAHARASLVYLILILQVLVDRQTGNRLKRDRDPYYRQGTSATALVTGP